MYTFKCACVFIEPVRRSMKTVTIKKYALCAVIVLLNTPHLISTEVTVKGTVNTQKASEKINTVKRDVQDAVDSIKVSAQDAADKAEAGVKIASRHIKKGTQKAKRKSQGIWDRIKSFFASPSVQVNTEVKK